MARGVLWNGDERRREDRRQILERRREARAIAKTRRKTERRLAQICYICHVSFTPKAAGAELVCPSCQDDGIRGGPRYRPRF